MGVGVDRRRVDDHLRRQEAMVAVWLLALWRALAVGGCHAFHPVAIALLVGGGLPLVSAHVHSSHRSSTPPR